MLKYQMPLFFIFALTDLDSGLRLPQGTSSQRVLRTIHSAGWILRNLDSTSHFPQKVRRDAELSLALRRRRITL